VKQTVEYHEEHRDHLVKEVHSLFNHTTIIMDSGTRVGKKKEVKE
jgi:hypothetical protein